jgi:hypothetical protein
VTSQAGVYEEGSRFGVHAANEHAVSDSVLDTQVGSVVHGSVVDKLTHECDGLLGEVDINEGHVEIIDEVDEGLSNGRTEEHTSALFNLGLYDFLETLGCGVVVEVDLSVEHVRVVELGIGVGEEVLDDGSLTGTGSSDIEDTLLDSLVEIKEVLLTLSLSSGDNESTEEAFE